MLTGLVALPAIDPDDPVLLLGDFNCEPWDKPFRMFAGSGFWRVSWNLEEVLRARREGPIFYSPLVKRQGLYSTYYPAGRSGNRLLDLVLLSRGALRHTGCRADPDSLRWKNPTLTDHAAIGIELEF